MKRFTRKLHAILLIGLLTPVLLKAQAPQLVSITPSANETDVEIDKVIDVEFDRAINVENSSANIYFFDADNDYAIIHQFQMTDPEVTVSGLNLIVNLDVFVDWPAATNVVMRIDDDAIIGWDGILSHPFQIENEVRPYLISTDPSMGETGVSSNSNLTMTFNENITIQGGSMLITNLDNGSTFESFNLSDPSVTVSGNQITITGITFGFDTEYGIEIGGYTSITDLAGNGFYQLHSSSQESWTFHTNPASPPQVISLSPTDGTENIQYSGQEFTISFNEDLQQSGYFLIRDSEGNAFEEFQVADLTFDGANISFMPQNDFTLGESYYITYSNVLDLESSPSQNSSSTFWNFTVEPPTPPTLISLSPADDAVDVEVDANFILNYSEPIFFQGGSPAIQLFNDDNVLIEQFDLPSARVSGEGTASITVDPTNDLKDDTKYYIRVLNAFEDNQGTDAENINLPDWTFDTGRPPSLLSISPSNNSTDVPVITNLVLAFDEPMEVGPNTNISIRTVDTDEYVSGINLLNGDQVDGLGTNTITLYPSLDLPFNEELYIAVPSACFQDLSGDQMEGWLDNTSWRFTTEPETPPTITSLSPADDAIDIDISNMIYTVIFSEDVQKGSGSISLRSSSNGLFRALAIPSGDIQVNGNEVVIDFTTIAGGETLEEGHEYYIRIDAGGFEDLSGSSFEGIDYPDWTFTTSGPSDNTAPLPVSYSPSNNAEEVSVNQWTYAITFNEPIQLTGTPGASFQLRNDSDQLIAEATSAGVSIAGNTLTVDFNFDGELDNESLEYTAFYHIEIDAGYVEDIAGNDFAGIATNTAWRFETEEAPDNDPPLVVSLSPSSGATNVAIDANLIIEFNEDIYLDNDEGTFELRRKSPDQLIEAFDIFGPGVTGGNNETTITINPTNDLEHDTEYYFLIGGNDVIIDGNDNPFAGFSSDTDWSFTTEPEADNTHPTIVGFSPADGSTDVSNDDPIVFTFSEDIQLTGFGPIRIRRVSNDAILHQIDPASSQVTINGNIVTIQPDGGFLSAEEEVEVYVNWSTAPFEDLAGNDFNGLFSSTDYRFTVNNINPDMTSPSIVSLSPSDDATDVAVDLSELVITFDEDVQKFYPGNIILRDGSGSIVHQYFPVSTDADVTVNGAEVTIALNETLAYDEDYYVQLASTTFEDLAGNPAPDWEDSETWNFTTEAEQDLTAPSLLSRSPEIDALGVGANTHLVLTFDEEVQVTGEGNIAIYERATGMQFGIDWFFPAGASVDGNEVTYDIPMALDYGTEYYIELTDAIEDLAGNRFPDIIGTNGWYFTVEGELNPPVLVSKNPDNGAVGVSITTDLELSFDENVQLTGGGLFRMFNQATDEQIGANWSFSAGASVNGNSVTYDIPIDLPYGTGIYFEISNAIEDEWGNVAEAISGEADWSITTEDEPDVTPPVITLLSPANDGEDVPVDTDLVIEFNEPVNTGSGTIGIHFYSNNSMAQTIDVASENVMVDGSTVTIDPPLNLMTSVHYWISISANAFIDDSGNAFAGITSGNKDDWNFTTGDLAPKPPVILSQSPANGATDIGINAELSLTFSEDIMLGVNGTTKQLIIQRVNGGGGNFAVIPLTADMISGDKLTIPHDDFESGITYRIILNEGVIADLENNVFQGLSGSDWTFTTSEAGKLDQSIDFASIDNKIYGDTPFELTGSSSSGLALTYSVVSGPVSLSGSTVTINGAGVATIAANQSGNEDFNPAVEVQRTFEIAKADQVIIIEAISDKFTTDDPFDVTASVNSGLELTYEVNGPATISGTTITLTGQEGTIEVIVSQSGDDNYNGASESLSFDVTEEEQVLSAGDEVTVTFYPNPMANFLRVDSEEVIMVNIFNLDGKLIKSQNLKNGEMRVSDLKSGIYLIEAKLKEKVVRQKIIKAN